MNSINYRKYPQKENNGENSFLSYGKGLEFQWLPVNFSMSSLIVKDNKGSSYNQEGRRQSYNHFKGIFFHFLLNRTLGYILFLFCQSFIQPTNRTEPRIVPKKNQEGIESSWRYEKRNDNNLNPSWPITYCLSNFFAKFHKVDFKSFAIGQHPILIINCITLVTASLSCATLQKPQNRIAVLTTAGAVAGASGGALLSPNKESQGLNALVFGLSGALTGGLVGILTTPSEPDKSTHDLKKKEQSSLPGSREFSIAPTQTLPDFVKSRVQPVIIEEFLEQDRVTEEGTLHEPHKAYRIKRPAELYANPILETKNQTTEGARK